MNVEEGWDLGMLSMASWQPLKAVANFGGMHGTLPIIYIFYIRMFVEFPISTYLEQERQM